MRLTKEDTDYDNTIKRMEQSDMSNLYGPRIVTDGLVLHLDAGNRKSYPGSGTSVYDLSGNNYNATLHGTTSVSNGYIDIGSGADTTNYISIPSGALDSLTAWTVEFWLYIHATNSIDTFLSCGATNDCLFYLNTRSGVVFQNPDTNGTAVNISPAYATSLLVPFLFTSSCSGTSIQFYKNGSLISNNTNSINFSEITVNSTLGIILGQELDSDTGNGAFASNQKFRGKYGQIKFYNRVLSANEVQQNYNALKGRFGL